MTRLFQVGGPSPGFVLVCCEHCGHGCEGLPVAHPLFVSLPVWSQVLPHGRMTGSKSGPCICCYTIQINCVRFRRLIHTTFNAGD